MVKLDKPQNIVYTFIDLANTFRRQIEKDMWVYLGIR